MKPSVGWRGSPSRPDGEARGFVLARVPEVGDLSGLISTSIRSALDCPLNYARSYLTELLPLCVRRVVYLDSDLILVDDIAKLSATPLGGGAVLAAPEYCNANFTFYFTFAFWSNPSLSLTFANRHTCYFNTCAALLCVGTLHCGPADSKVKPSRWLVVNLRNVDWNLYLNTLFWNFNYWDSISTLAGEVEKPKKTLPKALFYALIIVVLGYFFPLLMGTRAVPLDRELWTNGYFSDIAKIIGGVWLRWWIQGAAAVSNMGMFVAEMSSDSFQLLGMAEQGMLPKFFVLALSTLKIVVVSLVAILIGLVMQPCLTYVERKRWMKFSVSADLPDLHGANQEGVGSIRH
ncbi:hypothetical protein ACFX2I_037298 [Malus domestica]